MFDIGFWELCLIAIVALLILGPERLPTAARTAGKWINKIRSMVSGVKQEIDRELQLDAIREKMKVQEEELKKQSGLDDIQQAVDQTIADMEPIERSIAPKPEAPTEPNEHPDGQVSPETENNDSSKH